MSAAAIGVCPICLLERCERPHVACGGEPVHALRCVQCGEHLLAASRDGRCGFCQEEESLG